MISIIITTYKETATLRETLRMILAEKLSVAPAAANRATATTASVSTNPSDSHPAREILVIAPDSETRALIENEFSNPDFNIRFIQDRGEGKPAALNLAISQARGDILVLTDGDVIIESGALSTLLASFENPAIGAVSGQPISAAPRDTMLGYWSHWLTAAAHQLRLRLSARQAYFDCSGYLYAIRKKLIKNIPPQVLADDVFVTQTVWDAGYQLAYVPSAKVRVNYPTTWADWLKQKVRSTGGQKQKISASDSCPQDNPDYVAHRGAAAIQVHSLSRSFSQEARAGWKLFFAYPRDLREFWWTVLLFAARLYLWLVIFYKLRLRRWRFSDIWQRVESSK